MSSLIPVIALAVAVGNLLGLIFLVVGRITKVEGRVEILWEFLMRRGVMEALQRGVLERNSPIKIPTAMQDRYRDILEKVKTFYLANGAASLSDVDLAMRIETHFWPDIHKICLDAQIHDGACMAMMINYVRPDAAIFKEVEPLIWENDERTH